MLDTLNTIETAELPSTFEVEPLDPLDPLDPLEHVEHLEGRRRALRSEAPRRWQFTFDGWRATNAVDEFVLA